MTGPRSLTDAQHSLAVEYHLHHFACAVCIAASRGNGYGLRCAIGLGLWQAYQDAA